MGIKVWYSLNQKSSERHNICFLLLEGFIAKPSLIDVVSVEGEVDGIFEGVKTRTGSPDRRRRHCKLDKIVSHLNKIKIRFCFASKRNSVLQLY